MQEQKQSMEMHVRDMAEVQQLFGPQDRYMKHIEDAFDVQVIVRNERMTIAGKSESLQQAIQLLEILVHLFRQCFHLSERDILYAIELTKQGLVDQLTELFEEEITTTYTGKAIRVKSLGQRHYVTAIRQHDVVFGIGPAGTGKTYLAVVLAVRALKNGDMKRIVLTRPAVEAGENLGFLPGDLQEKVDPYLRPLYDALNDTLGPEQVTKYMERGMIEIAPLAYMRGRTLDDSFVILDEAQNTTPEQIKMFLTRLGFGSKMVITGDVTQIDLPKGTKSGLIVAEEVLAKVKGLSFIYMQKADVVRHPLVQRIIAAYDK